MVILRCPQCSNTIDAAPGALATCSKCGFSAPAPRSPPMPTGYAPQPAATPAMYAPAAAPPPPAYGSPQAMTPVYSTAPTGAPVAGKPRKFWISLLLGIVTFGIYFYIWNYVAFRELDKEHGEKHGAAWYWTALAVQLIAIMIIAAAVVVAVAATLDQPKTDPPAEPDLETPLFYAGLAVSFVGTAIYLAYLFQEVAKVERYRERRGLPTGFSPVWFVILYILGALMLQIPTIVAYYLLTNSTNGLWAQIYAQKGVPYPA